MEKWGWRLTLQRLADPPIPRMYGEYFGLRRDYPVEEWINDIAPEGVTRQPLPRLIPPKEIGAPGQRHYTHRLGKAAHEARRPRFSPFARREFDAAGDGRRRRNLALRPAQRRAAVPAKRAGAVNLGLGRLLERLRLLHCLGTWSNALNATPRAAVSNTPTPPTVPANANAAPAVGRYCRSIFRVPSVTSDPHV
jgi:hypothetical protein